MDAARNPPQPAPATPTRSGAAIRRPACGRPAPAAPFPALLGGFLEARPLPPPGLRPSGPGCSASRPVGPVSGSPAPSAARPAAIRPRRLRFPPCWAGFGKSGPFRRPACGHPAPAAPLPALLGGFLEALPLSPPGLRLSCPGGSVSRLVGRVWGSLAPFAARPAAVLLRLPRFPPCWAGFGKPGPFRRPACGRPAPAVPFPALLRADFRKHGPFRRPACGRPAPAAALPALLGRFREARPLSPPGLQPSGPNRPGEAAERTCFPLGASPSAMQREAFLPAKPARKPPISRAYRLPGWGRPVPMGMLRLGPRLVGPSGGS